LDSELHAQLTAEAQHAVETFLKAEEEYKTVLAELEEELPEGFDLLWSALDARNAAVVDARKKVRAARAKFKPFSTSVRKSLVFDTDTFVGLARELGCYQDLRQAGVIKYTVSASDLEERVEPQVLERLKETGRVVETSVAVYGPNELTRLK